MDGETSYAPYRATARDNTPPGGPEDRGMEPMYDPHPGDHGPKEAINSSYGTGDPHAGDRAALMGAGAYAGARAMGPGFSYHPVGVMGPKPSWWTGRRICVLIVSIIVALAIIAGIVVGVIEAKQHGLLDKIESVVQSGIPDPNAISNPDNSHKSTSGAWNGTGIGALTPLEHPAGDAHLYFQHYDGSIRQSTHTSGTWSGGDNNNVVDKGPARNASPVAARQWLNGTTETWHVVWVGQDNYLHDAVQLNGSGSWIAGSIASAKYEVAQTGGVALAMLSVTLIANGTVTYGDRGVRVYYGGVDNRVHEVSIGANASSWKETFIFDEQVNSNAGIAVDSQIDGPYAYFFYSNLTDHTLNYYWQDTNVTGTNSAKVPLGVWEIATGPTGTKVATNSSLGYSLDQYVIFQDDHNNIMQITPDTTKPDQGHWDGPDSVATALPGTRISFDHVGDSNRIWFQDVGNGIAEVWQDNVHAPWQTDSVTVG